MNYTQKLWSFILVLLLFFLNTANTTAQTDEKKNFWSCFSFFEEDTDNIIEGDTSQSKSSIITELLNFAFKQIGKPYHYHSMGPNSFDCSGFTSFVFNHVGITLKRTSKEQSQQGTSVKKKNIRKGDLVFFKGSSRSSSIGHVGIVSDVKTDDEFSFIHAATSSGIIESKSSENYYAQRYVTARRILSDNQKNDIESQIEDSKEEISKPEISTINEKKTKEKEITHRVKKGETLYSISKKYNCSVRKLKKWNKIRKSKLNVGQQLKIKTNVHIEIEDSNKINNYDIKKDTIKIHRVEKEETLYSISKKYNCSVSDLQKWNNLKDNTIKIGQELRLNP